MKKPFLSWVVLLLITSLVIAFVYIAITFLAYKPPAETFNFAVSVSPESGSIEQGRSVQTTVNVTLLSGTPQIVTLSASELPSEASVTFNLSSGSPTFTSTLTIFTAEFTPTGNHTIIVIGTGGGLTKTTNYTLTVASSSQPFDFSVSAPSIKSYNFPGTATSPTIIQPGDFTPEVLVEMDTDTLVDLFESMCTISSNNWAVYWDHNKSPGKVYTGNLVTNAGQKHHITINIVFRRISDGSATTLTVDGYVQGGSVSGT